eukprot:TRINITY_DN2985_c0_g1_i1.p1 TRINITY_DN2985_c0_g1~~TRINITY_DN2985_c0_g1_i1.p1  ORF type:complete len:368 (-),score=83.36 TRINITY_DN2985_c0_g1_i1:124-1227(-)
MATKLEVPSLPYADELLSPRALKPVPVVSDKSAPLVEPVVLEEVVQKTERRRTIMEEIRNMQDKPAPLRTVAPEEINDKSSPQQQVTATVSKEAVTTKAEVRQELFTTIKSGGFKLRLTNVFKRDKEKDKDKKDKYTTLGVDTSPVLTKQNNAVFGVDLLNVLRRYSRNGESRTVPIILEKCIAYIEANGNTEGIYRLSGSHGAIQKLKAAFNESEQQVDLDKNENANDVHCVTGVLKLYFRELPNPLLTYELYDEFVAAVSTSSNESVSINVNSEEVTIDLSHIKALGNAVTNLPKGHYDTLKLLISHLRKILTYKAKTNMSISNIAIVWAPTLMRALNASVVDDLSSTQTVMEVLLAAYESIFNR